jgi:SAM-dependent methyltransferase
MQISSSNIEWRAYGKIDYGASDDLGRGAHEWAMLRDHLEQYKLPGYTRAVEIGCGNGRLTRSIARDFQAVEALDVSEERLARARGKVNLDNVYWHLVDEPRIPAKGGSADLVSARRALLRAWPVLAALGDFVAGSYSFAAASRVAMSNFTMFIIAAIALGCFRISLIFSGTICQHRPNLSVSQPQAMGLPSSSSLSQ